MSDGPSGASPPGWYTTPEGHTAWWDGAQWLQAPPEAPVAPYEPLMTLSGFVFALLALCGALAGLTAVLEGWRYLMVQQMQTSFSLSTAQRLDDAEGLVALVGTAYFFANLACIVVFLVWLHRVFMNLNGPLRSGVDHSPGWAVGWWFVPFANFVKPKQVLDEAWCASEPVGPSGVKHWTRLGSPLLVWSWWVAFIFGGVVSNIFINDGGQSIGVFQARLLMSTVGSASLAVAAVLAVLMVRQVTARNTQRAVSLGLVIE